MSDSVVAAPAVSEVPVITQEITKPEIKDTEHIDKFASKFAALTRKEKEFNEKFKSKETEYAQKLSQIEENRKKFAPYEELDREISTNKSKALDFLLSKGLSIDEIGQMLMDHANPDPEVRMKKAVSETENSLRAELKALREEFENKETKKKQSEEEELKKQHEKVIQGVMADLTEFVNKSEDYELIKSYNNVDMVYEVMNQHYTEQVQKGIPDQLIKILSYKEACDAVEAHLDEQVTRTYEAKRAKQAPKKEEQSVKQTSQTLSNTLSTEVPVSGERKLSRDELTKEAAKLLRWVD
jgi:hypothetical protein